MIKGQDIDSIMTIYDTTPGRISVWIMVIMLFFLYLIFLFLMYEMELKRLDRFVKLKHEFELALAQRERKRKNTGEVKAVEKGPSAAGRIQSEREKGKPPQDQEQLSQEDQEALVLFDDLKHSYLKRW